MTASSDLCSVDAGSFRDPAAFVVIAEDRVFRVMTETAWGYYNAASASGILERLIDERRLIATWPIANHKLPQAATVGISPLPDRVLEHERVPFISYPYEWSFSLLKRAAIHHLSLQIDLLSAGFVLSDASAYNIQFRATNPVFIDVSSIRPYVEGEYWVGYRQFCEQFLNPLLLFAICEVPYQSWLRGTVDGIPMTSMARILPWHSKLSWRVFLHVMLHARLSARSSNSHHGTPYFLGSSIESPMSKGTLRWLLSGLRNWIENLRYPSSLETAWGDYSLKTPYTTTEMAAKHSFIIRYIERVKPTELFDLGCNTGIYSEIALVAGANHVIGFDCDHEALEQAIVRADRGRLNFLPIFLDLTNPSPDQGWAERERGGFTRRAKADGLLALALVHHVVIGRNVPMKQAVAWLISLAPTGVIEFVPKQDPMIRAMLAQRVDIFPQYTIEHFREELSRLAVIVNDTVCSDSGRTLFEYRR